MYHHFNNITKMSSHNLASPSEISIKIKLNMTFGTGECRPWALGKLNGEPNLIWSKNSGQHVNVDVRKWIWNSNRGIQGEGVKMVQNYDCLEYCCNIDHMSTEDDQDYEWDILCKYI